MFHPLPARWLAVFPAMAALAAVAQPAPDTAQAPAPAAALAYKSAFEGYRPFTDEKPIPWKEANETVRERGGWRAYAKEAADAPPAAHQGHTMPAPAKKEQKP